MKTIRHAPGGGRRRAPAGNRPLGVARPPLTHRRGQVLIILILAMTLLVALVFYVYNLGLAVNDRMALQNTADAVATAGAAWMARCMNVVAMDNVAQAKMLSLVPILDAQPLASEIAWNEVSEWEAGLSRQIGRGAGSDGRLMDGLKSLQSRMATQRDILAAYLARVSGGGFRMEDLTFWAAPGGEGPPPHGRLWQAAVALDELSQTAVASCGMLAQSDAVRFGQANQAQTTLLIPLLPQIPARRTEYAHFGPPLRDRLVVRSDHASYAVSRDSGGAIPDWAYPHRLGPWARLMRWRDNDYRGGGGGGGGSGPTSSWSVALPGLGGGVGSHVARSGTEGGSGGGGGAIHIGYRTYGPFAWALRSLYSYAVRDRNDPTRRGELADTKWQQYVSAISRIKLEYMFGSRSPRQHHYPKWLTEYPEAVAWSQTQQKVFLTKYYYVEELDVQGMGHFDNMADPVNRDFNSWMPPERLRDRFERSTGSSVALRIEELFRATDPDAARRIFKAGGGSSHVTWTYRSEMVCEMTYRQIADYIWKITIWFKYGYVTSGGFVGAASANMYFVFGGIDVGQEEGTPTPDGPVSPRGQVTVRNPANWADGEYLPAPILLDTSGPFGDYDPADPDADKGVRREVFTLLGLARIENKAGVWQSQFVNANPSGGSAAMAQVEVFNNSSWDLWTQDWRVQLVPVTQYADWMTRISRDIPNAPLTGGLVDEKQMLAIYEYLSRLEPAVADMFLKH